MVVDDDGDIRKLIVTNLRSADYEVLEADSGQAAVALYEKERPGIVLLDVMMPHMSGFETAEKLRALDPKNDLQIVFLTAHGGLDNFAESRRVKANDFLTKPIPRADLLRRISALQRVRALRPK